MNIKILTFGIAKEILGGSSINVELNDKNNVSDLMHILEEKFPSLQQLSSFRIAINNHFASTEEVITDSDEIAIIPPVSGG